MYRANRATVEILLARLPTTKVVTYNRRYFEMEEENGMSEAKAHVGSASTEHPSGDKRFRVLEVAMKRHQFRHDALIEVLHTAQELFGYLELDLLYFIARHLKLPPSRVYGVATFYHFFTLKPKGRHTCVICTGTACYVKGADALLTAVRDEAHLQPGDTSEDGEISLLTARCLGACGNAPVVIVDGAIQGHQTPDDIRHQMKGWLQRGPDGPK
jgi:bidirectional [NiFe] hydrogenase diaphorase subunit